MMAAPLSPVSAMSTPRSSRASSMKANLTLDLSNLPPLMTPTPPSNTLLITGLDNIEIFEPRNLIQIRQTLNEYALIHTWAPLTSFRRVIVSFFDVASAKLIKQKLDGEAIMGCRVRVYFGAHTDITPAARHLKAPTVDKLFFISPPPSPPHGWEIRSEDPPNKEVHAEDLADALAKLHARNEEQEVARKEQNRQRSTSVTVVYAPAQHGSNPSLPAISVEDTEFVESPTAGSPMDSLSAPMLHTARPPVELMEQ